MDKNLLYPVPVGILIQWSHSYSASRSPFPVQRSTSALGQLQPCIGVYVNNNQFVIKKKMFCFYGVGL